MNPPGNCKNCEHRSGTVAFGRCLKTGYYIETQRKYPTGGCDENFSGWAPRVGPIYRFLRLILGTYL